MRAVGIIPARWASERFPGKPLAPIAGRPMLQRVYEGACSSERLERVLVATDDPRIADLCDSIGAPVVMTSSTHPTGTDRLAEVARGLDVEVVVNIQGDEPLIEASVIDAAVDALRADPLVPMATVARAAEIDELADPNSVKVVVDRRGRALYFSRSPIPWRASEGAAGTHLRHVGLYAYRRDFLLEFVGLARGHAEQAEALEQLRALEHGHPIRVAIVEGWLGLSVDVPADVARVEARLAACGRS